MKKIFPFIVIFLSFIIQSTLFQFISIMDIIPNISLLFLIIFSIQLGEYYGGLLGLFLGLLTDVLYLSFFGINTLIYFIIGYILGTFKENVYREDYLTYYSAVAIMSVVYNLIFYLFIFFLRINTAGLLEIMRPIILEMILNLILLYPVLKLEFLLIDKVGIKVKYY
ncbi:MAG: rod shape-determining protein MreD [Bacillota bacterium]|nr:rod shape-determining protein MreD [Bacillota bacterium]